MRTSIVLLLLTALAFAQPKGDQQRSYAFPETGESIPYHLYVPTNWTAAARMPLLVVLHGMGAAPETPFERNNGILKKLAEERGYVVVAPAGYKLTAGYNNPYGMVPAARDTGAAPAGKGGVAPKGGDAKGKGDGKGDAKGKAAPITAQDRERSEKDVMLVAEMIAKEYSTDPRRTYLMGNSMGGGGTWYLGQKYNNKWAAIVPTAGPLRDADYPYDRLKAMPVLAVHGDADTVLSFPATEAQVKNAKSKGVDVTFIPVKGGDHFGAWAEVAPQIFDFLGKHARK